MLKRLAQIAKPNAVMAVIFGLVCVYFLYVGFSRPSFPPVPPLFATLNFHDNQGELRKRLNEKFPVGTPEQTVTADLRGQGFTIQKTDEGFARRATFERLGDVTHDICRRSGEVTWAVDAAGGLTQVDGSYAVDCP